MKPLLSLLLFVIPLIGCTNLLYISKLGWHQSYITFHSIPIHEILERDEIGNESKEKIQFIQEVKRFGEERLGLRKTDSYSKFFEIKGPVLYVITASKKDSLELYSWNFPILGKVTYKSFFKMKDALKEKTFLEEKGHDTFIQSVNAYSTLGWFKDPIFSTMLDWDEPTLSNIILHEMTHSTIYFKGETELNEQIATFVGNQGSIDFLTERYGIESDKVLLAIDYQEDDFIFSEWIDEVCRRLASFYERPIPKEEKIKGREEIFNSIKEEFKEIKDKLKTESYKNFDLFELNNALLLAYRQYTHRLKKFKAIYHYLGNDLKKMIELFKIIKESGDKPSSYLDRWMRERGIFNIPGSHSK